MKSRSQSVYFTQRHFIYIHNELTMLHVRQHSNISSNNHCFDYMYFTMIGRRSRITWWRHQMETFSVLLALCSGTLPVTVKFPPQSPPPPPPPPPKKKKKKKCMCIYLLREPPKRYHIICQISFYNGNSLLWYLIWRLELQQQVTQSIIKKISLKKYIIISVITTTTSIMITTVMIIRMLTMIIMITGIWKQY